MYQRRLHGSVAWRWSVVVVAGLVIAGLAACQRGGPRPPGGAAGAGGERTPTQIGGSRFTLSGPYQHDNLTVFLIHSDQADDRDFVTLDEGLKSGQVKVTEQEQAEVRQLMIENGSDKPLYLQEGDRLVGGKQDRIVQWTLVVPPRSGRQPVPTFCIEQSRWHPGATGQAFGGAQNSALANLEVRYAAKYSGDQTAVWREVGRLKDRAEKQLGADKTTSSLNEAMDDAKLKKVSDDCAAALAGALRKTPDAVGVVMAINGQVREVDLYPGHKLLAKMYPRLLQSYAVNAALAREGAATQPRALTTAAVRDFLATAKEKSSRQEKIDTRNGARLRDFDDKSECVTEYDGKTTHYQLIKP